MVVRKSPFNCLVELTFDVTVLHKFVVKIWTGILGDHLLDCTFFPQRPNYLPFLQQIIPVLMQGIPATVCQNMFFMYDYAPAHFAIAVHKNLDARSPGGGLDAADQLLIIHALRNSIPFIYSSGDT